MEDDPACDYNQHIPSLMLSSFVTSLRCRSGISFSLSIRLERVGTDYGVAIEVAGRSTVMYEKIGDYGS